MTIAEEDVVAYYKSVLMELTLNLIWVCVAVAAILVQIVMQSRAGAPACRGKSYWRQIVAMACALVILFFVISMTDDLHDQALLLEETKFSRITAGTKASAHSASDRWLALHLFQFFPVAPFSPPPLATVSRFLEHFECQFATAMAWETFRGRAPPAAQA